MKSIGLISIIMAAYNAGKTIDTAVSSVLAQTYGEFELIVINDCSADNTADKVRAYNDSRIVLLENEKNMGVSRTRHRGAEAAKGDWIAILDSDDAWEPDKLEKQAALASETGAELLYTGSAFMTSGGKRMKTVLEVPEAVTYKKLLRQNILSNSSSLVKRELFLRNEVQDDNIHEDYACWLRILKSGRTAYGINEPLLIYRLSDGSKSGNKLRSAAMNWRTYRAAGVNIFSACFNMVCYTVNGLAKYSRLNKEKGQLQ